MSNIFRILVVFGILAIVLAMAFSIRQQRSSPVFRLEYALDKIRVCMGRQKAGIPCAQPIVRDALNITDESELMKRASEAFNPKLCHQIGHLVGQQSFKKTRSVEVSLAKCSRDCDSGCPHGVISEASAQELGIDDPEFELGHLSDEGLLRMGKRLCISSQTCHGVGHALLQAFQEIPSALSMCDRIAQGLMGTTCYGGVYMEHADIQLARSTRNGSGVQRLDVADIDGFCENQPSSAATQMCFLYLPLLSNAAFGEGNKSASSQASRICDSYKGDARGFCFAGIGASNAYLLEVDVDAARAVCERFKASADEAACNYGQMQIALENRKSKLYQYCDGLKTAELRSVCLQGFFARMNMYKGMSAVADAADEYCGKESACLQASKNASLEPWDVLRDTFAR